MPSSASHTHGAGNLEVPVSVVAGLSLLAPPFLERDAVAVQLLALRPHQLAEFIQLQWQTFVNARPDLVNRIWPLMQVWHRTPPLHQDTLRAAKHAPDAALLELTGDTRRREADLFGPLLTLLRPHSAITERRETIELAQAVRRDKVGWPSR